MKTGIEQPTADAMQSYVDEKLDENLNHLRQRIAYDFRTALAQLKKELINTNVTTGAGASLIAFRSHLNVETPLQSLDNFAHFEAMLATDEAQMQTARNYFGALINAEVEIMPCISEIMKIMVTNSVELEFSAHG